MKQNKSKQTAHAAVRAIAILGTPLFCIMIALAAGQPCDNMIPKCSDCQLGQPCGASGEIVKCTWVEGSWFHCNGRASDCPVDEGYCNIYVETPVQGYLIECEDYVVTEGFCAVNEPGESEPLNHKCEGGPCYGQVADELPPLTEGAGDDDWPLDAPSWSGAVGPL